MKVITSGTNELKHSRIPTDIQSSVRQPSDSRPVNNNVRVIASLDKVSSHSNSADKWKLRWAPNPVMRKYEATPMTTNSHRQ